MPIHATSDAYRKVVAVPTGESFHSARTQPSGSISKKRRQSPRVWFQPTMAHSETAKGKSSGRSARK
jgi:hypothetical protein